MYVLVMCVCLGLIVSGTSLMISVICLSKLLTPTHDKEMLSKMEEIEHRVTDLELEHDLVLESQHSNHMSELATFEKVCDICSASLLYYDIFLVSITSSIVF